MGETAPSEVTQVAAATSSQDPEVGLAAVAALRGPVEVLETLQVHHKYAGRRFGFKGYRGAAGPLLEAFGVELDQLGGALLAELGAGVP